MKEVVKKRVAWNKGKKLSITGRKKLSDAKLKNPTRYWFGKNRSKETIEKLRKNAHRMPGETNPNFGKTWKASKETRIKMSKSMSGEKNWNWQGGLTDINKKIRHSLEYRLWRESVFKRDNFICKFCGKRGGKLHADHIKAFSLFPELRFAIDR